MARAEQSSLRFSRIETRRLTAALLISLCVHLGAWGGYELNKKFHWWEDLQAFLQAHKLVKKSPPPPPKTQPPETEPQIFVDVSDVDPTPPQKAKYYSNNNSHAANPDADKDLNQPKLDGKQKFVPKTETVPKFSRLQPSSPPPQPQTKPAPAAQPQTQPAEATPASSLWNKGDVKLAKKTSEEKTEAQKAELEKAEAKKVEEQKKAEQQPQTPPRPRTLKAAQEQHQLPGQQMQQDGGVHHIRVIPAFDTKATAFGNYDAAMFEAIEQYWDDELERNNYADDRQGRVTIQFILNYDGTVTDLEITHNEVGILFASYCQQAIYQTAPYAKWPDEMLRTIGSTHRPVTLTFIYY